MKQSVRWRRYVWEAVVMLAVARLAVRVLPAARLVAWASRPPRRIRRFAAPTEASWVATAIEHIGAKPWMNAACLPRALAAQSILRRHGIASQLCLGLAREDGRLSAHAWIELDQQALVGGAEALRMTRLVEFGGTQG
jgi:hypothetical protein